MARMTGLSGENSCTDLGMKSANALQNGAFWPHCCVRVNIMARHKKVASLSFCGIGHVLAPVSTFGSRHSLAGEGDKHIDVRGE